MDVEKQNKVKKIWLIHNNTYYKFVIDSNTDDSLTDLSPTTLKQNYESFETFSYIFYLD